MPALLTFTSMPGSPYTFKHLFNAVLLVVLFSGCGTKNSDHTIFRFNQVQGVESLDPAFAKNLNIMWHVQFLYNRLLEFGPDMRPRPSLAKQWSISADRLVYRFELRTDVYFHDNPLFSRGKGRRLNARDVVYSFKRLTDPGTASPGAWVFNDRVDTLEPFRALNDSVFELRLQAPFNPMIGILSMPYCSIVPEEVAEHWGKDFRSHPCGTGPFVLQDWEEGVAITYRKNGRYWERDSAGRPLPYIDGIKVTFIDSKATEFLQFLKGELDFMNGIDASFKDQVLSKKGELKAAYRDKIRLWKNPYLNVEYLGFLLDSARQEQRLLLDRRIRLAINYGFDRGKLVRYLRNGIGRAANGGIIPDVLPGHDTAYTGGYPYLPEKARALIAEVQQEQGGTLPPITLLSNDNYSDRCQFIASELRPLGLDIRVEIMQPSLLREQMSNGAASFFWGTWIADYPDAEIYLTMFYGPNAAPPNYTRFRDATFDAWYAAALHAPDTAAQRLLYRDMDRRLVEMAPCVPLFYDEVMHFTQQRVRRWNCNTLNLIDLKTVQIED